MRADRQQPSVYFGAPGSLVTMPWPRGDIDASYDRLTFDFVTGAGQHQVSTLIDGSRLYVLTWNALHVDNYRKIEQYWTGSMGPGPWALVDPSRPNLLLPNQAAATAVWNTAKDWSTSGTTHGGPSSNTIAAHIHRVGSPRSLRWFFQATPAATPILSLGSPHRNWLGIPVQVGLSYAFSCWVKSVRGGGGASGVNLRVTWYNSTGGVVSTLNGSQQFVIGWGQLTAIGVAPAGAAYAVLAVILDGSSISNGDSLYLDEFLFEQDTVVNDWAPGTGVRAVQMLGFTDFIPFAARFRTKAVMTLRELAQ